MSVAGAAHSTWQFWDGRKDSLWAQALGPLESAVEHGGDRTQYAHLVAAHYAAEYEAVFGPLPDLGDLPPHAGPVADPDGCQEVGEVQPLDAGRHAARTPACGLPDHRPQDGGRWGAKANP